ncbi:MAG TPA: radical SAM protein [Nitrospina sp.]|nr:radical SAM protein [Nitrospina sp.]
MARVLLVNPNKWGRGVTAIWIASHAGLLRRKGHVCELFDCTFYNSWTDNENSYNTANQQYRPTGYDRLIVWNDNDIFADLQAKVDEFNPDIILGAALSSHIHGEGEYASIQYYHELISRLQTNALKVAGGLQPTAETAQTAGRFHNFDMLIAGESELAIEELAVKVDAGDRNPKIPGLVRLLEDGGITELIKQPIIDDLDVLGDYDYSIFEDQVFLRPYNGEVVRAVDYEISRGCIYVCSYCVETSIQSYYGFTESSKKGAILRPQGYLRAKSAKHAFREIKHLHEHYGITLFRCQDTNFLTIAATTLEPLAKLIDDSGMDIKLYIETRPEGINNKSIHLLNMLKVNGVGMGVEAGEEQYRETNLHRYANQDCIVRAFDLLHEAGIRRTAYNVIGFPNQGEESIIETIKLNILLNPDNITVAFYSPFIGTDLQRASAREGSFEEYAYGMDSQLRSRSIEGDNHIDMLKFFKRHFEQLVRGGLEQLSNLKNKINLSSKKKHQIL